MKTHTLGTGQFMEFIVPVKGMKHINIMRTADIRMKWRSDHRSCDCDLSNRKVSPKNVLHGFNGIRTHGLCVSLNRQEDKFICWINAIYQYFLTDKGEINDHIAGKQTRLIRRPKCNQIMNYCKLYTLKTV